MSERFIIMMQILEFQKSKDMDVATKVSVQLQYTHPDVKARDRVVRKTEKDGLYNAIDVAVVWLERALATK
jgi:ribosome-associated translation inhibitor RaiA